MTTTTLDLSGFYADSVVSGLTITQDALLDGIVADGIVNIDQAQASVTGETNGFTASKDTYVDVTVAGVFTYVETVIDAGAPALTADSIRIAKVVTDGTEITSVVDMRTVATDGNFVYGTVTMTGTAISLYNPTNSPIMIRHGAGSTSDGFPLKPDATYSTDETVYARPNRAGASLIITQ